MLTLGRALCLTLGLMLGALAPARAGLPRVVRRLGVADGLSDRAITSLWQDGRGFLWIGTGRGLDRFDGYELRPFEALSGCQLPAGAITAGLEDAAGRTWLGTRQGLYGYDPGRHRLRAVPLGAAAGQVVPALVVTPDDHLWLVTSGGYLVEVVGGRVRRSWLVGTAAHPAPYSLTDLRYLPAEGAFLLQTYRGPALRFVPTRGCVTQVLPVPGLTACLVRTARLTAAPLLATADALLTAASADSAPRQLATLRRAHWPDAPYHPRLKLAALTDDAGRLWLGTGRGQLTRYDQRTGTLENLAAVLAPNYQVNVLFEDRQHNLWLGTEFGLVQLDNRPQLFEPLAPPQAQWTTGHPFSTRALASDGAGNLYVASYAGLFRWYPTTDRWTRLEWRRGGRVIDFAPYALYYDGRDTLWIGSEGAGLLSYCVARGTFATAGAAGVPVDPRFAYLTALAPADQGCLWLGDYRGLRRYHPRSCRYETLPGAGPDGLRYYALLPTADGGLYAGTAGGLRRLDGAGRLRATWPGPDVLALWADRAGRLWLGTRGGLVRLDPRTGQRRVWGRADGLADDQVASLLPEGDSALWLGTQNGLSRLSLRPGARPRTFYTADGLAADEFNQGSAGYLPDGRLVLGGLNGLSIVQPAATRRPAAPPDAPLLLSGYTLLDGATGRLAERAALPAAGPLTLAPADRLLTVRFALADFGDLAQHRYEYRLDGLDTRWLALGTEHQLRLTTLPAGTYTLRVRASGAGGHWSRHQLVVSLIIHPVFWRTPWFAVLVLALSAGALYGLYRQRLRVVLREERLRADLAATARLYALIGHDLRGPVSTFNGLVRLLDHYLSQGQTERLPALTERVRHSVGQLTSLLHNLLSWAGAQSGDLAFIPELLRAQELLVETCALFAPEAESRQVTLTVEAPADLLIRADPHMLRAVLRNLTANALHAAAGGLVRLAALPDPLGVRLTIADTGAGMAPAHAVTLTTTTEPPVAQAPVQGTGLGLRLVRLFVARHGGRIEVLTPPQGGTTIHVRLPA